MYMYVMLRKNKFLRHLPNCQVVHVQKTHYTRSGITSDLHGFQDVSRDEGAYIIEEKENYFKLYLNLDFDNPKKIKAASLNTIMCGK